MELILAWYWLVKLTLVGIILYTAYKAFIVYKFEKIGWNIVFVVFLVLGVISPVKIDGTNTTQYHQNQVLSISANKTLAPKVESKDFRKISTNGITNEDLK